MSEDDDASRDDASIILIAVMVGAVSGAIMGFFIGWLIWA